MRTTMLAIAKTRGNAMADGKASRGNSSTLLRAGLVAVLAAAIGFACPRPAHSQQIGPNGAIGGAASQTGSGGGRGGFGRPSFSNGDEDMDPVMAERRMRALNTERQKQMVSDATKLLKLARDLNDEVAKANSGAFTPEQLHKIGEIEKLARNVRERMTAAVGEAPSLTPPPTVVYPIH